MANGEHHDSGITFTTKELILQLDAKVETLLGLVAAKADQLELNSIKTEVAALKVQMEHRSTSAHSQANELMKLHGKVNALETKDAANVAVAKYKKWFFGVILFSALSAVAAIVSLVIQAGG